MYAIRSYYDTFGTGKIEDAQIARLVQDIFSLTPEGMIDQLELRRPQYQPLAAYGHFGRIDLPVAWEKTDRADALRADAKLK